MAPPTLREGLDAMGVFSRSMDKTRHLREGGGPFTPSSGPPLGLPVTHLHLLLGAPEWKCWQGSYANQPSPFRGSEEAEQGNKASGTAVACERQACAPKRGVFSMRH